MTAETGCRPIAAHAAGLAESAVAGLRAAGGELLLVLDLSMLYAVEDVVAVARALDAGDAALAVASRPCRWTGAPALRLLGTTDPTSGLVGLTRSAVVAADDSLAPVGSRFCLELLARVGGRRVDVPVGPVRSTSRASTPFGDLRQIKRLADDRFGNISRLLQFCSVGASGMVVDLTFYAIFQWILGRTSSFGGRVAPIVGGPLDLALSAVLAIAIALDVELHDQPPPDVQRRQARVDRPAIPPLRPEQPAGDRGQPDAPAGPAGPGRLLHPASPGGGRGGDRRGDGHQLLDGPLVRLPPQAGLARQAGRRDPATNRGIPARASIADPGRVRDGTGLKGHRET